EDRRGRQLRRRPTNDFEVDLTVRRVHSQLDAVAGVLDVKRRALMFPGKEPAARQVVYEGSRVAAWNVNPFVRTGILFPYDRDAMSGILAGQSDRPGKTLRPDLLQPNQADACDGIPVLQLRTEGRGKVAADDVRRDPKVHEQSPSYDAVHF